MRKSSVQPEHLNSSSIYLKELSQPPNLPSTISNSPDCVQKIDRLAHDQKKEVENTNDCKRDITLPNDQNRTNSCLAGIQQTKQNSDNAKDKSISNDTSTHNQETTDVHLIFQQNPSSSDCNTDQIIVEKEESNVVSGSTTLQHSHTVDRTQGNEKKMHRRQCGKFTMTRCCCCCLIAANLGIILLVIVLTIIALIFTHKKGVDANTTVVTITNTISIIATTITMTTTTTTTSISTSTSTTSVTTVTSSTLCSNLRWNQTGETVAGNGSSGSNLNQFRDPTCIEIDANDNIYICDHHNYRIQMWTAGATTGITVIDTYNADHPEALTFDKNGNLYLTGHVIQRVLRYSPNFSSNITVAGVLNTGSTALNNLNEPLGMDVDNDLNLYIAERDNRRVVKWSPNATNGTIVIGTMSTPRFYGLLLSLNSTNQAYVSSEEGRAVYLWTFGASSPTVTLTQVNGTPAILNNPRGIEYDTYGNLYVCDKGNQRVVMYCVNSTVGTVVVNDNTNTNLRQPDDVAFDSNLNMYVVDNAGQKVIKYTRL